MSNRVKIIEGEYTGEEGTITDSSPTGKEVEFDVLLDSGKTVSKKFKEVEYVEDDDSKGDSEISKS